MHEVLEEYNFFLIINLTKSFSRSFFYDLKLLFSEVQYSYSIVILTSTGQVLPQEIKKETLSVTLSKSQKGRNRKSD